MDQWEQLASVSSERLSSDMYPQILPRQSLQPIAASSSSGRAVMTVRANPLNDPRSTANAAAEQLQLAAVPSAGPRQPARADPQQRVMSPNALSGFPRELCQVCQQSLAGPLVVCACCASAVHGQCAVALGHDVYCERCVARWQYDEDQRAQREHAAHTMGVLTARGSEMLGTALGAASAASVAAGRSLVAGAAAGVEGSGSGGGQGAPRSNGSASGRMLNVV